MIDFYDFSETARTLTDTATSKQRQRRRTTIQCSLHEYKTKCSYVYSTYHHHYDFTVQQPPIHIIYSLSSSSFYKFSRMSSRAIHGRSPVHITHCLLRTWRNIRHIPNVWHRTLSEVRTRHQKQKEGVSLLFEDICNIRRLFYRCATLKLAAE